MVSYKLYLLYHQKGGENFDDSKELILRLTDESEIKRILVPSYNFYQTQYQVLTRE